MVDRGLKSKEDQVFVVDMLTLLRVPKREVCTAKTLFLFDTAVLWDIDSSDLLDFGVFCLLALFQ